VRGDESAAWAECKREADERGDELEAHHRPESYAVLGDRLHALNKALTDVLATIRQR